MATHRIYTYIVANHCVAHGSTAINVDSFVAIARQHIPLACRSSSNSVVSPNYIVTCVLNAYRGGGEVQYL